MEEIKIVCPTIYPWWNARLEWLLLCEPRKVERLFKNNRKKLYQELKEAVQRAVNYQRRLDKKEWAPDQIAEIVMQSVAPTDVDQAEYQIPEDLADSIRAWAMEPPEGIGDKEIQERINAGPSGVGGWLALFCGILIVVFPLITIMSLARTWVDEALRLKATAVPLSKLGLQIETIGSIALAVYGIVIGNKIRKGDTEGKRLAKQYLKVNFVGSIGLEFVVTLLIALGASSISLSFSGDALVVPIATKIFFKMTFFSVWWVYFDNSKRVKNTYDL